MTNNANDTISGYRVGNDGVPALLDADGVTATTGDHPVDLAATGDGRFLYNVNAGAGTVGMYRVDPATATLTSPGEIGGLPDDDGAVGIAGALEVQTLATGAGRATVARSARVLARRRHPTLPTASRPPSSGLKTYVTPTDPQAATCFFQT